MIETIGILKSGNEANEAKKFEAAQLEQKANEAKAISQKNAQNEKDESQLIRSAAAAAAGKTGTKVGGEIFDRITAEGQARLLTQLYLGNAESRQDKIAAQVARIEGKNAKKAAKMNAAVNVAKKVEAALAAAAGAGAAGGAGGGSSGMVSGQMSMASNRGALQSLSIPSGYLDSAAPRRRSTLNSLSEKYPG